MGWQIAFIGYHFIFTLRQICRKKWIVSRFGEKSFFSSNLGCSGDLFIFHLQVTGKENQEKLKIVRIYWTALPLLFFPPFFYQFRSPALMKRFFLEVNQPLRLQIFLAACIRRDSVYYLPPVAFKSNLYRCWVTMEAMDCRFHPRKCNICLFPPNWLVKWLF